MAKKSLRDRLGTSAWAGRSEAATGSSVAASSVVRSFVEYKHNIVLYIEMQALSIP